MVDPPDLPPPPPRRQVLGQLSATYRGLRERLGRSARGVPYRRRITASIATGAMPSVGPEYHGAHRGKGRRGRGLHGPTVGVSGQQGGNSRGTIFFGAFFAEAAVCRDLLGSA